MSFYYLNLCLVALFLNLTLAQSFYENRIIDKRAVRADERRSPGVDTNKQPGAVLPANFKLVFFGCAFLVASAVGTLYVMCKFCFFFCI